MKGCIISAPQTGSGKTTVTLGLLAALRRNGIRVQPFKVGPDFIDPGLHQIAAGVPSHNLDGWMMTKEANLSLVVPAAVENEILIVEGMMGLFDGFDGRSESGSTAQMAKWLDLPVVLVIDASGMARSAAAVLHGLRTFDPQLRIAGVIFNRVAGNGHARILRDAVRDVPILGCLPPDPSLEIPERHLGLLTGQEELAAERIQAIAERFERYIDVEAFVTALPRIGYLKTPASHTRTGVRKRVALAHDKAFSFYYQANRLELQRAGGEIVAFSPLVDREVPEADFLYIGGGYPELYRAELEANKSMRNSVKRFIESGGRFYAECGGLMYLAQSIEGSRMAGVLDLEIEMTGAPVNFGYCEVTTRMPSVLGPRGTPARGHQFHYSRIKGEVAGIPLYDVKQGQREYTEGYAYANGLASYIHLHFLSNPAIARNMLES
jgi:cobyrinic acid a,c-diamide synthase